MLLFAAVAEATPGRTALPLPFERATSAAVSAPALALDDRTVEYRPLEREWFAKIAERGLGNDQLLAAAVVAGGADRATLDRLNARFEALVEEFGRALAGENRPRQRAARLFDMMHARVLRGGYDADCTDLRVVFDEGRFNCVSSVVLFNALASRLGLSVDAVEAPAHVYSLLRTAEGSIDVQTTCSTWSAAVGPESESEYRRLWGSPLEEHRNVLAPAAVVATIYYNRGIDDLRQGRFVEAVAANVKALRLNPDQDTAWKNLLATWNNWAVDLCRRGEYAEAAGVLRHGHAVAGGHQPFATNYVAVYQRWTEALCDAGDYAQAIAVLERADLESPMGRPLVQTAVGVYRRWGDDLAHRGRYAEAEAKQAAARRRFGHTFREAEPVLSAGDRAAISPAL